MTRILYKPDDFLLRAEGHAEAAPETDPVCAGVSALTWALVEAATARDSYKASLFIDSEKAVIEVQCFPGREAFDNCRYMFEVIVGGLMLIAEAHPEHVLIRIGG